MLTDRNDGVRWRCLSSLWDYVQACEVLSRQGPPTFACLASYWHGAARRQRGLLAEDCWMPTVRP